MKRWFLGVLVLGSAWVFWPTSVVKLEPQRSLQIRKHPTDEGVRVIRRVEAPPAPVPLEEPLLVQRAQDIQASCGLPVEPHCAGQDCVVVLRSPDLDTLSGWGQLVFSSPTFVGSVVARDLGVRSLPCADAIASLGVGEVHMVELDDGSEVWCAGTGPTYRELCERRSGVEGFTGPTRTLSF